MRPLLRFLKWSAICSLAIGILLPARYSLAQTTPGSESPSLQSAVMGAMAEKKGASMSAATIMDKAQVNVKRRDKSGNWVFGSAVIVAPKEENAFPEGWLFVAEKTANGWNVGLEGSDDFRRMSREAPESIVSQKEKNVFGQGEIRAMAETRTGLQLPYAKGATWIMSGGPHGWAGSDRPYSSLDLYGGDQRVLSAGPGYAYTMCSNNKGWIRVVHDNGYTTDYYHLWDNIVVNGARVSAGSFLGYTGTDVSCGGAASGRHVHFALLVNGSYVPLHEKEIGTWLFYEGAAYGGYARHGSTIVYPGGGLYNYGILASNQGVVDANGGGVVNLRSGPGTQYPIVGSVSDGAIVTVQCTANGTTHSGRYGPTSLWNRLTNGHWMSDAFLWTGTSGSIAPSC